MIEPVLSLAHPSQPLKTDRSPSSQPDLKRSPLDSIERAIAALKVGQAVVVVDDEDRENEGDRTYALTGKQKCVEYE